MREETKGDSCLHSPPLSHHRKNAPSLPHPAQTEVRPESGASLGAALFTIADDTALAALAAKHAQSATEEEAPTVRWVQLDLKILEYCRIQASLGPSYPPLTPDVTAARKARLSQLADEIEEAITPEDVVGDAGEVTLPLPAALRVRHLLYRTLTADNPASYLTAGGRSALVRGIGRGEAEGRIGCLPRRPAGRPSGLLSRGRQCGGGGGGAQRAVHRPTPQDSCAQRGR